MAVDEGDAPADPLPSDGGAPQPPQGNEEPWVDASVAEPEPGQGEPPPPPAAPPPLAPTPPSASGPRLQMERTRFLSSERVAVHYVDVTREGDPFVGLYEVAASQPFDSHRIKFGKDDELASDSREFKDVPPGTYHARLVYDEGFVADEAVIQVVGDRDEDGVEDALDGCPDDDKKVEPGACGCDVKEKDDDRDGTPNCVDDCPKDSAKIEAGMCGCGFLDSLADQDADGVSDCFDQCPFDSRKIEKLQCGCGELETDRDNDGTADCKDKCPTDPAKTKAGECGCGMPETDSDLDGAPNCVDGCPFDPAKQAPGACGCGERETFLCV